MLSQYIQAATERAHYEIIQDEEPYYGEIPGIEGLWAAGESLEECRKNLLKELGFEGPYSGGRHEFMLRGTHRIILPNPHVVEILVSHRSGDENG